MGRQPEIVAREKQDEGAEYDRVGLRVRTQRNEREIGEKDENEKEKGNEAKKKAVEIGGHSAHGRSVSLDFIDQRGLS